MYRGPDSKKIRVLYINQTSSIGGAETNLLNILRFADQGGFQPVGVLLPDEGPLSDEVQRLGIPVEFVNYYSFQWRNPFRYAQTLAQLVRWIRRTHADLIHLNHQWLTEHVAVASLLTQRPFVCHFRSKADAAFVNVNQRWLNHANAIVAVSKDIAQTLGQMGILHSKITIILDGINLDSFNAELVSGKATSAFPVIGFVGRLEREKGVTELLQSVPLVVRQFPKASFVLVGKRSEDDVYFAYLSRMIENLKIANRVKFTGFRQDVPDLLHSFDVFVLPSHTEGLPNSILESLATGCLVVTSAVGGIPEIITDGINGFLVPPADSEALAVGVLRALTLPGSEKERIRQAGKELVARRFSIERQVARLGQLYQELLA